MAPLMPDFHPSILPKPIANIELVARKLLEKGDTAKEWGGVGEDGERLVPFGSRSFFLANAPIPSGHIQFTPDQIALVVVGDRRHLRKFLHRLRSIRPPSKATFMSGPSHNPADIDYAYTVHLNELQVFEDPSLHTHIAVALRLGVVEWIPKPQLLALAGGDEGEWEELEPMKTACALLREDNRQLARATGSNPPKGIDARAWRTVAVMVLDHCNQGQLPKSFKVAWAFVDQNHFLTTYARDRALVGPAMAKDGLLKMCAALGEERWRVVEKAIDGYERGLRRSEMKGGEGESK